MGRSAQREREWKRAAKCCQSIEKFVKKKKVEGQSLHLDMIIGVLFSVISGDRYRGIR